MKMIDFMNIIKRFIARTFTAGNKPSSNASKPAIQDRKRWCLFTSAGDRNAIRLWLDSDTHRQWDLVVAYYGDNDNEFMEICKVSAYAFRIKGGKFQNLKKFMTQNPKFFNQYTYVWVCDDDILMSVPQINEAFAISERFEFWVAQPAYQLEGAISHSMTAYAGSEYDYRIVNFVEVGVGIFRRDKLMEFLNIYDGSLTGWGIDYWYMNFFDANTMGRFAIIDKVQIIHPHRDESEGREIERLQPMHLRVKAWQAVKEKYGLVEFPHKIFAYCKIAPD